MKIKVAAGLDGNEKFLKLRGSYSKFGNLTPITCISSCPPYIPLCSSNSVL